MERSAVANRRQHDNNSVIAHKQTKTGVHSVRLALDILETIAFSGEELGVTQVAQRVGATKGTVHRHLLTLVERGYLKQNLTNSRYGIGAKSNLFSNLAPNIDLADLAEETMRELRDILGHTVVLSSMTPSGALVISTITGTSSIEIGVRPGSELSFHASAQGKVLLALAPHSFQQRILSLPLQTFTIKTVVNREEIEAELIRIVKNGYATASEQVLLGINAVAAPIFDQTDACIASVAVVGSIQFLREPIEKATVATIKACSQQISRKLGNSQSGAARRVKAP